MCMKTRADLGPRKKVTPRVRGQGSQGPRVGRACSWWRKADGRWGGGGAGVSEAWRE